MPKPAPPLDAYEFCLWLKGFIDVSHANSDYFTISAAQIAVIRAKLEGAVTGNQCGEVLPGSDPPDPAEPSA